MRRQRDAAGPDQRVSGTMPSELVSALVDEFAPTGNVLELACETGTWTRELVRTNDYIHLLNYVRVAPRTLRAGRQFDVIKVYWNPNELDARLRLLDWPAEVRRVGETFLYGSSS